MFEIVACSLIVTVFRNFFHSKMTMQETNQWQGDGISAKYEAYWDPFSNMLSAFLPK